MSHSIFIKGEPVARGEEVLTPQALSFIAELDARFASRRCEVLEARRVRRAVVSNGRKLDFLPETRAIREDRSWRVAPPAPGLIDRRVEITGPPTPTMTVNALNSGANVWMADFEDASTPTWNNMIEGQITVLDALARRLDFTTEQGKRYKLNDDIATIVVRPRGWHLVEKHMLVDGRPVSASIFDFGMHFFHGAQLQLQQGRVPGFYLPKLESHLEARLWNDIFTLAQEMLGIPHGTIRATVLIETIPAAFEMEEILFELREHSAGLNAGRWDYVFSVIKYFGDDARFTLPDRSAVTMTSPFLRAYTELLVKTCHARGAHAIGGMAAAVPSKSDEQRWNAALSAVRADKTREAHDGFDGSWVAHPALVPVCREVFDTAFDGGVDQRDRQREDVHVGAAELLSIDQCVGEVTDAGVRANVRTSLRYLAAWFDGSGAVALDGLMEDAATVEISRSQLWQWLRHGVTTREGHVLNVRWLSEIIDSEWLRIEAESASTSEHARSAAVALLREMALGETFTDFFTTVGYARYLTSHAKAQQGAPTLGLGVA